MSSSIRHAPVATNEYLHDGLRVAGDVILPRLVGLAAGTWSVTRR